MSEISPAEQGPQADFERSTHNIEGTEIQVNRKMFLPTKTKESSEQLNQHKAVVYFPGFGYTAQSKATEAICQMLADIYGTQVYALDMTTQLGKRPSLLKDAKAAKQLLEQLKIDEITIAGHSRGGTQGMHLAALTQGEEERIKVNGLLLFDAVSLYDQRFLPYMANFRKEQSNPAKQDYGPKGSNNDYVDRQETNRKLYKQEGENEIKRQIKYAGIRYPFRLIREIQEFIRVNPSARELKVPIIMIHGEEDLLSQPKMIAPHQQGSAPVSELTLSQRDEQLKKLFPKSTYRRLVLGRKQGHHGLAFDRTKAAVIASKYFLKQASRIKPQS